jgi:hypothetical protein
MNINCISTANAKLAIFSPALPILEQARRAPIGGDAVGSLHRFLTVERGLNTTPDSETKGGRVKPMITIFVTTCRLASAFFRESGSERIDRANQIKRHHVITS